ncbi:hypothetical protein BU644_11790 [Staphylococcus chromogenes]|nr:hypothetical protein BU644_11790 [Staphylococcus chromogenes]
MYLIISPTAHKIGGISLVVNLLFQEDWNEEYEGMNLSCKIFSFKIRLAKKTPKKHNS